MNEIQNDVRVVEPPATDGTERLVGRVPSLPARRSLFGRLVGLAPGLLALAAVAAVILLGLRTGWKLPKFSALAGRAEPEKDDWCEEHSVPDSICVMCKKDCMPRAEEHGWCRKHGVAECPYCHPDVAQLPSPPAVLDEDLQRYNRAMELPRISNNPKCKMHQRIIQLADGDVASTIGVRVTEVGRGPVADFLTVNGEVGFDHEAVARLSSPVPGVVSRVYRQAGQWVAAGELLALVESAEVGRAKAEFQQALAQVDQRTKALAALRASPQSTAGKVVSAAESALEEARIRRTNAEQALANLGLPLPAADWEALPQAEVARRLHFLGLPTVLAATLDARADSANLYPLTAPQEGVIVSRPPTAGEKVDVTEPLFVVADTRTMWLTLDVRLEDARRMRPGQAVTFRPDGGDEVPGAVTWLSTAVDEKTRTIKVRVRLPNRDGRLKAGTFGSGQVMLREEQRAIVVPSEAVHWEGDCHVVFIRDKDFDRPDAKKVFHVRKVQPGVTAGGRTEILAGVLPGELVATKGSGIFRSELLRGNLGAG